MFRCTGVFTPWLVLDQNYAVQKSVCSTMNREMFDANTQRTDIVLCINITLLKNKEHTPSMHNKRYKYAVKCTCW